MGKTMIKSYGLLWLACLQAALAQKCNPNASWWLPLHNSHLEDPCAMSLVIRSYCGANEIFVAEGSDVPLPANDCLCNALTYVLYGACFECQGVTSPTDDTFPNRRYSAWISGCTLSQVPFNGIDVPEWARLSMNEVTSKTSTFSIGHALEWAIQNPITTTIVTSSTTQSEPTGASNLSSGSGLAGQGTAGTSTPNAPLTTAAAEPSASPRKSNIGPIVGGVIGGVAVLALIFGLLFFCRRKRNRKVAPSSEFAKYHKGPSLVAPHSPTSPEPPQFSAGPGPAYSPVRQASGYESGVDEELPGFTPGTYAGPVYEKPGQYIADPNVPPGSSSSHAATRPAL